MSKVRNRITFSNVIALLALFIALGGSAYAATKLSGKQIKPKTIPANRIKPGSLTTAQIKESSLKAVKSAIALNSVTYATATGSLDPAVTTPYTFTANCPSGLKAVGGGATFGNPDDGFYGDGNITSTRTGYTARVYSGTTNPTTVTVTAACVAASTSTG